MALANHIGHDKRGNTLYLRDKDGNEIVEEVELPVREYIDGVPVLKNQKTMRKVIDDNTGTVAAEFRKSVTQVS
ncbi:hypothetical protein [Mycobacterium shimoidei]|uniref:hypothetical protein n=1 Tax=Mycobacterium shimoidei TaxID=29313 RepID=UPI0012F47896|nr:hypothetical protein [Mycobacterium shimoidei]MCV7258020.1 hypothetical protein [Mycobacterium shimoidei]